MMDIKSTKENPNLLLITIDCLRPDFLDCYGATRNASPAIDNCARHGLKFENAFSAASSTPLSTPALLTGTYPLSAGGPTYLTNNRPHIAELLSAAGYETVAYQTNSWLSYQANYPRGFDAYHEHFDFLQQNISFLKFRVENLVAQNYTPEQIEEKLKEFAIDLLDDSIKGCKQYLEKINWQSEEIIQELEEYRRQKRLMQENFISFLKSEWEIDIRGTKVGGHLSWISTLIERLGFPAYNIARTRLSLKADNDGVLQKPFMSADQVVDNILSDQRTNRGASNPLFLWAHFMDAHEPYIPGSTKNWTNEFQSYTKQISNREVTFDQINKQDPERLTDLYAASIRFVDDQVRRLIDFADHLPGDTIVIITSDHGEEFNEHGAVGHDAKLYDELIHVPLILYSSTKKVGRTINRLFSHVDFIPSIIGRLTDVNVPLRVEGTDVFKQRRKHIIAETLRTSKGPEHADRVGLDIKRDYKRIAARSRRRKLIYFEDSNVFEYYNLLEDPYEQNNLHQGNDNSALQKPISDRLEQITTDLTSSGKAVDVEHAEIIRDQLDDLGYL